MPNIKYLVTVGEGKYFSTGVDLNIVNSSDPKDFLSVLSDLQQLLSRLIVFPLTTVAAINGKSANFTFCIVNCYFIIE